MSKKNVSPVSAVLLGAGLRGREVYGEYALKHSAGLKFTAVAEPDPERRRLFQDAHFISPDMVFDSWDKLLHQETGQLAEAAFICTPDNMHYRPALAALKIGYDLVIEKPISPHPAECQEIAVTARKLGRKVQVCHVLRFTEFWRKVKEIIDSGEMGRIIHFDHSENVSYWHFGHSYVRGNYKNAADSSPFILAKSCHDLDLLYWIIGSKALSVQSMGDLSHYRPESAPHDIPERCTDGCLESETCPWYAPRTYLTGEPLLRLGLQAHSRLTRFLAHFALNHRKSLKFLSRFSKNLRGIVNWERFPATVITTDLSAAGKMKALREGPYGKCIFRSGNDVLDHQVTTYVFPGGVTGTLTLHGMSDLEGREIRIFGTKGTLRGYFRYNGEQISVSNFRYGEKTIVYKAGLSMGGHGGGDVGLMDSFVRIMRDKIGPHEAGADIENALEAHYMAFAAEDARIAHQEKQLADYQANI